MSASAVLGTEFKETTIQTWRGEVVHTGPSLLKCLHHFASYVNWDNNGSYCNLPLLHWRWKYFTTNDLYPITFRDMQHPVMLLIRKTWGGELRNVAVAVNYTDGNTE